MSIHFNPLMNSQNVQTNRSPGVELTKMELQNFKLKSNDKVVQQFAKGELNNESSRSVFQKIMVALEDKAPGVANLVNKLFGVLGDASTKQRELLHFNLVKVLEYEVQHRGEKAGHDLTDTQITMINFFCGKSGGLSKDQREKLSYHKKLLLDSNPLMKGRFSQHSATKENIAKLNDVLGGRPEKEPKNNRLTISDKINHSSVNSEKRLHNLEIDHGVAQIHIESKTEKNVGQLAIQNLDNSRFMNQSVLSSRNDGNEWREQHHVSRRGPEIKYDDQNDWSEERKLITVFGDGLQNEKNFKSMRMATRVFQDNLQNDNNYKNVHSFVDEIPKSKHGKYSLSYAHMSNKDTRKFELEKEVREEIAKEKELEVNNFMYERISYDSLMNAPETAPISLKNDSSSNVGTQHQHIVVPQKNINEISSNNLENMLKNSDKFNELLAYVASLLEKCETLEQETIIFDGVLELTYSKDERVSDNSRCLVTALLKGGHLRHSAKVQSQVEIKSQFVDSYKLNDFQSYEQKLDQSNGDDGLRNQVNSGKNDTSLEMAKSKARTWIEEVRYGLQNADWMSAQGLIEVLIRHAYFEMKDLTVDERTKYGDQAKGLLNEVVSGKLSSNAKYNSSLLAGLQEVSYNILATEIVELGDSRKKIVNLDDEENKLQQLEFVTQYAFWGLPTEKVVSFAASYRSYLTSTEVLFIFASHEKSLSGKKVKTHSISDR